ncbi:CvpA family protein [Sphingomonas sp. S2-65]|uniref:CvpA family protein n=1 Tax=Sphingomonas sp. S2-65 TaxID=2903960 RepID=UPI001F244FFD|nr:CvpA family protein [Sphingomonas sp. S2-65]UYY58585.1 CvpA family protein [Sphingomonas sp. S2-65]
MALTGLDIIVLLAIGGAGVLGFIRGFVTEVLALLAWLLVVLALKLFHGPLSQVLASAVGTVQGGAVLAFALLGGATYFGGRLIARSIGGRTRDSFLGPIDRALGFGFGALKGLVLVSVAFLLVVLVFDTVGGGKSSRPAWITGSATYPILDRTSAGIAEIVDRRRRGEPVFGKTRRDGLENASHSQE